MKDADRRGRHRPGNREGVYAISVVAELTGVGVQTLRLYERHGLITPARSSGGTRRYSHDDLARLHRITELTAQGIPLTAVGRILELEDANAALRDANATLAAERDRLRDRAVPCRHPESTVARPPTAGGAEEFPTTTAREGAGSRPRRDLARSSDNS